MSALCNRRIVVALCGGIAAYKGAELVRQLRAAGAEVQVVMTAAAQEFITPLSLQALSGHPVHTDQFAAEAEAGMGHIELARWADRILVAPASADCLARLAAGRADDLLGALCLASDAPLVLAPAMNQGMWRDPATAENCRLLRDRGITLLGPADGEQACGDVGPGRMLEPEALRRALEDGFESGLLQGRRLLITAGPTFEALDPVRYIANRSSGRMGFAMAEAACQAGAVVTVVAGPVQLPAPERVRCIPVRSAEDMHRAVMAEVATCEIFIATAAVADYRPEHRAQSKIAKDAERLQLNLVRNPDILREVAAAPGAPFTVGFAAETDQPIAHAQAKLLDKRLAMICANQVGVAGSGFDSEDNILTVLWKGGEQALPKASKRLQAERIIALIAEHFATWAQ